MKTTRNASAQKRAGDDSGFVMLVVVALTSVLALIALSALVLSRQAVTDMERSIHTQTAFQAANAGIDRALARLVANPTTGLQWPLVGTVGGATYSVTATLSPSSTATTFSVMSQGTFGGVRQTVSQQYSQTVVPAFSMWDKYMFTDDGFTAVNGWSTTNIWGSVYAVGDAQFKSIGGLPAEVASRVFTNNVYVFNGQVYIKDGVNSTFAQMNLLANAPQTRQNPITGGKFATWSMDCPEIELPDFGLPELQSAWSTATLVPSWAPSPTSLTAGENPLTIELGTPTTTYAAEGGVARLKWTQDGGRNGRGLLTVKGVVYIDGDLTLPPCNYTGRGTLVVRGDVTLKGALLPKNGELVMNNPPEYTPLSESEVLGIVTPFNLMADPGPGNNIKDEFYRGNYGMAGAFYVGGLVGFKSNNNRVKGAILARGCDAGWHNVHLVVDPDLPDILPPGMPGGAGIPQQVMFQRLFNTWSRQ